MLSGEKIKYAVRLTKVIQCFCSVQDGKICISLNLLLLIILTLIKKNCLPLYFCTLAQNKC